MQGGPGPPKGRAAPINLMVCSSLPYSQDLAPYGTWHHGSSSKSKRLKGKYFEWIQGTEAARASHVKTLMREGSGAAAEGGGNSEVSVL